MVVFNGIIEIFCDCELFAPAAAAAAAAAVDAAAAAPADVGACEMNSLVLQEIWFDFFS